MANKQPKKPKKKHKNSLDAKGNFVIYLITIAGRIFKYGKADADRITIKPYNIPTRLHQQIRKLLKIFPNVTFQILNTLRNVTTRDALKKEREYIDNYVKKYGRLPPGNKK